MVYLSQNRTARNLAIAAVNAGVEQGAFELQCPSDPFENGHVSFYQFELVGCVFDVRVLSIFQGNEIDLTISAREPGREDLEPAIGGCLLKQGYSVVAYLFLERGFGQYLHDDADFSCRHWLQRKLRNIEQSPNGFHIREQTNAA